MSDDATSIPMDDEDILDLTVVAKPGAAASTPPEPGGDLDFSADLDSLLDSLGAGEAATPTTAPARKAAPIDDQTPVDHAVDPDEELAMPEMSDIDSLLQELGEGLPATPKASEPDADDDILSLEPQQIAAKPAAPKQAAPKQAAPDARPRTTAAMPELEGILAQAQAAEAEKAAAEAAQEPVPSPAPQATPEAHDGIDLNELDALLDDILATAPASGSPAPQPSPAPQAPAAPIQAPAAPIQAPPAPEGIPVPDMALVAPDFNEEFAAIAARLDRLEASPAPVDHAPALAALEQRLQSLENATAAPDLSANIAALEKRLAEQAERLAALEGAMPPPDLSATVATLETAVEALTARPEATDNTEALHGLEQRITTLESADPASDLANDLVTLQTKVEQAEEAITVLEQSEISEAMMDGFVSRKVEEKITALLEPDSQLMRLVLQRVQAELANGTLTKDMEKMAAAAAATVIREEIADLMQEDG